MTAMEWLLWFAAIWAVLFAYCATDAPALTARAAHFLADRIRHGGTR